MRRLIAITVLALALAACKAPSPAGVHVLTYASPYAPGHPFSKADITWMKFVEQRSGGRIKIKPYWAGSLISSEQSIEEIRHGIADVGLITPIYTRGGVHLVRGQSGYYGGVKSIEDQVAIYKCLYAEFPQMQHEMRGLKVLAVQGGAFPGVLTRERTVRSLADLKGLRLRVPTELTGLMKELGADPVDMPMGGVYSAMAKGVIDGVVAPPDTFRSLHFGEIAKRYTTLHVSRGAYPARAMSLPAYDALPPDLRAVLDEGQLVWEKALAENIKASVKAGEKTAKETGVTSIPIGAADQSRFDLMYNEAALKDARALKKVGVDGEPVFRRAQALIAGGTVQQACK